MGPLRAAVAAAVVLVFGAKADEWPFQVVYEHWTEIVAPMNGERFAPGASVRVVAEVRYARLTAMRNASTVRLPLVVAAVERSYSFGAGEAPSAAAEAGRVRRFCEAAPSLEEDNCDKVRRLVATLAAQVAAFDRGDEAPPARLCVAVRDGGGAEGVECGDGDRFEVTMDVATPESYVVEASVVGALGDAAVPGSPHVAKQRVRFEVDGCRPPGLSLARPRRGDVVDADAVVVEVRDPGAAAPAHGVLPPWYCVSLDDGAAPTCGPSTTVAFPSTAVGRRVARAWREADGPDRGGCVATVAFEVRLRWDLRTAVAAAHAPRPRLVTAVSERYVAERILENLVASLHFWEPGEAIDVYDLGLSEAARAEVEAWEGVTLVDLAPAAASVLGDLYGAEPQDVGVPPHVLNHSTYAFKAFVVADALRTHGAVLWVDANCELRRPADEVRLLVAERGHFLVGHPYAFPTPQFHHPAALELLGCDAPDLSREHCATTFIGVTEGSWLARRVLPRLVDCAAAPHCINPPGSSRLNHRQEQTALNAILCNVDPGSPDNACHADKRFRMTTDFENDDDPVQPTADETDWNDIVLYTRRNHPIKPYLRFLRRKQPRCPGDACPSPDARAA